jgi:dTDP-4-amino-4,6-dideoxygalactose transaminase
MEMILSSVPRRTGRIVVQSYTCRLVSEAISRAGFVPVPIDFTNAPNTISADSVRDAIGRGVDAFIVTHLFGIPFDCREIVELCGSAGIPIIEDCAHTLGGRIDGAHVGTLGDAAFFSFNYDKPVPLGWGGLVAIREGGLAVARGGSSEIPSRRAEWAAFTRYRGVMSDFRGRIGRNPGLPGRIVGKGRKLLGAVPGRRVAMGIGLFQAELAILSLRRMEETVEIRNRNAQRVLEVVPASHRWPIPESCTPAYLKLRLFVEHGIRDGLLETLRERRVRAGNSNWPEPLWRDGMPVSSAIADDWIDLPIHQGVGAATRDLMRSILAGRFEERGHLLGG